MSERSGPPDTRAASVGFLFPAALAEAAGGHRKLLLPLGSRAGAGAGTGITVAEALHRLGLQQPGVHSRICDETGAVRRHVNLYLDGEDIRNLAGQSTVLAPGAEILVLQSIAGG